MYLLLLSVIYISFISLGLPDSILGAAWPVMAGEFSAPLSYAGIISMIICFGTVISSLMSDLMTRKLGTGLVTAISVLLTAAALLGFSLSRNFIVLCFLAIPYGLGAGAVDAALNNYVALHYKSRHMSWLHCFWGLGATAGPYIMGLALQADLGWRSGYGIVSAIQFGLTFLLFVSLPIWKKRTTPSEQTNSAPLGLKGAVKIPGVKAIMFAFFGYSTLEATAGLWASSYLVNFRSVDPETAATFASLLFLGLTVGRFLSGFVADRVGDKNMIRAGLVGMGIGIVMILLPTKTDVFALAGLIMVGFGAAPIYPAIIHSTPTHFGAENSQAIVGIQMASAYCGSTFMPPLFGLIAQHIHIGLYPVFLLGALMIMIFMTEKVNRTCRHDLSVNMQ